jgi:hypothetical protein
MGLYGAYFAVRGVDPTGLLLLLDGTTAAAAAAYASGVGPCAGAGVGTGVATGGATVAGTPILVTAGGCVLAAGAGYGVGRCIDHYATGPLTRTFCDWWWPLEQPAPVPRPFPRSNPNKPCPCTINAQVTNKAAYNLRNLAESGWKRNGKPITEPFSNHFEAALYEYKYGKTAHDNLILKHNPSFAGESHLSEFDGPCSGLKSKIRTLGPQIIACQRNNQIVPKECSDALSSASNTLVRYCDPLGK